MYFHSDTLVLQDRDLEIHACLFDFNVAESVIVSGDSFTREGLDSISLTIDIPFTSHSQRSPFRLDDLKDKGDAMTDQVKMAHVYSAELDSVTFVNPVRHALMLAGELHKCKQKGKVDLEDDIVIFDTPTPSFEMGVENVMPQLNCPLWTFIEDAFANFVGMQHLKLEIFKQASLIKVQQLRKEQGISSSMNPSRHMVFRGSPGTGKTTVARIIADVYFELGLLPTNEVVETDRSDLVGQYLGETAIKTAGVIQSAIGGVLFIDEAYSLTEGEHNEYGNEAINILLKLMEDHREELVVIVAGYQNEMQQFVESNPGLKSRFNRMFDFYNYTPEELWEILEKMCNADSYIIKDKTYIKKIMLAEFQKEIEREGLSFSNGRFIRNLFERIVENQSFRVVVNNQLSKLDLMVLRDCDFMTSLKISE